MDIKDGRYKAKARQAVLAKAGTGTPEVAVEFILADPSLEGQGITWHGFLTDKTFDRTVESLRHCGWKGDDLSILEGVDANEVELVIENEANDEGDSYPRVRWVNRLGGGLAVKDPMKPDEAKAFAAKMKGRIRALDVKAGEKKPNGGQQRAPATRTDEPLDDIPF